MSDRAALTSYAVSFLVDHLVLAERDDSVHELLARETRGGSAWYALKQQADDDHGYARDLAVAWELADRRYRAAKDRGQRAQAVSLQVRYALISAALDALSDRLTPERLRRLVRNETWSLARARAAAARASDPSLRVELLASLAGVGSDADVRSVLADALGDPERDVVLPALAARLKPRASASMIAAARALGDEDALAAAIEASAQRVPARGVEPLLREASRMGSRPARARAVVALAPRVPARLADDVVLRSGLLDDADALPALLESQGARLTRGGAAQALEALRRLPASARRTEAALSLLERLPVGARDGALRTERKAAGGIPAADARAIALAKLALPTEAVKAAAEVSPARRASVIAEIAPELTPVAARRALGLVAQAATAARATALTALAARREPTATVLKLAAELPPRARATNWRGLHRGFPRHWSRRRGSWRSGFVTSRCARLWWRRWKSGAKRRSRSPSRTRRRPARPRRAPSKTSIGIGRGSTTKRSARGSSPRAAPSRPTMPRCGTGWCGRRRGSSLVLRSRPRWMPLSTKERPARRKPRGPARPSIGCSASGSGRASSSSAIRVCTRRSRMPTRSRSAPRCISGWSRRSATSPTMSCSTTRHRSPTSSRCSPGTAGCTRRSRPRASSKARTGARRPS